jgi:putative transposase
VYQGRFKAIPVSADHHFLWVCRYVERNALRACLVENAEEWRWSSLRRENRDWLAEWPVPRPSDWLSEVNRPQTEEELAAFRQAMRNGLPYGNPEWRLVVMARSGFRPARHRGRPRRPSVLEK